MCTPLELLLPCTVLETGRRAGARWCAPERVQGALKAGSGTDSKIENAFMCVEYIFTRQFKLCTTLFFA